ncbi:class I SAM-dependent methyltransferase [Amycolatopsis silviterrae]|uniref:S-adenosyl-L-methionine-dependent methyltransferase n=1 Tax=Amycolatopsis silviterrae TaxID=1656914 RepID=A0ABW5H6H5_9PSEU
MNRRPDGWDVATDVGATAVVAAAGRAVETHRADALISDPYAERLVAAGDPGGRLPTRPGADGAEGSWRPLSDLLGIRGKFIDDALRKAVDDGVRQVVILAAGLDSRAHRLPWPAGTTVFEIDQPAVLEFKRQVLPAAPSNCAQRLIPADLRDRWESPLRAAGFDGGRATVWVAEGLLYYLSPDDQQNLLRVADENSAPGSRWVIEDDPGFLERMADPEARAQSESLGLDLRSLLDSGPRPDPVAWLREHGWVVESRLLRTAGREYGRSLTPVGDRVNGPFVLADARKV